MKPARDKDDQLIRQFKKGDDAALATVYRMWFADLCYFAFRIIGDYHEAKDITANTLEILMSKHENFETMANVKAFLYITIKNRCFDYLNYLKRTDLAHKEAQDFRGETENFVLSKMIESEYIRELYEQIELLPNKPKEVMKLFYIEGWNISNIAQKLGMTPEAVSTAKSRGISQLRGLVSERKLLPLTGFIVILLRAIKLFTGSDWNF